MNLVFNEICAADLIIAAGGLIFNLGLVAYNVWFTRKIHDMERKLLKIYILANQSIDDGEGHYDSLCNHIQTNREIELDIYAKVREK